MRVVSAIVAVTLITTALSLAQPAQVHESSGPVAPVQTGAVPSQKPSADSNWTVEIVHPGVGSAVSDLAVAPTGQPVVAYYPPGEVRYAVRQNGSWTSQLVATTPFGGASLCMAVSPDGTPHIFYTLNGFVHAFKTGSVWTKELVEFVPGTLNRECDASADSLGRIHVAWASEMFPISQGEIKYAVKDSSGWIVERIDSGGRGSVWASLAMDSRNRPHVLYYGDVYGEVRYARRSGSGSWTLEVVEALTGERGYYCCSHDSLALDINDVPMAAYLAEATWPVSYSALHYATKTASGWRIEKIVEGQRMPGFNPAVGVTSIGVPVIAYHVLLDGDLMYAEGGSSWTVEPVDTEGIYNGQFISMSLDACGNPHISYYLADPDLKSVRYATKGPPCSSNRPPTANAGGPYISYEGTPLSLAATAADPDNDPLTYHWDFDNDGMADTSWSSSPAITHTWPDDFTGTVRVEVSDNKTTANATAIVTILNLPPTIDSFKIPAIAATATLRIAGEKWHDVSAYTVDGGSETLIATLSRQPGKPQEATFPIAIDPTKSKSIRVEYTPDDDKVNGQPNGATPAWLTFTFDSGSPVEMHHTFNVKHPETWNWTVSLNQMLAGREVKFTATATDSGSDDLTFTWEWGDYSPATVTTYLNGGAFPFTVMDEEIHFYDVAGTYDLKVTVSDDDGDAVSITFGVLII